MNRRILLASLVAVPLVAAFGLPAYMDAKPNLWQFAGRKTLARVTTEVSFALTGGLRGSERFKVIAQNQSVWIDAITVHGPGGKTATRTVRKSLPPGQRMEILRRLGAADSATIELLRNELRDRFGRIPPPAASLLHLFALKRRCQSLGIRRLLYPGEDHCLLDLADARRFHRDSPFTSKEAAVLTNGMIHVRLPHRARAPEQTLAFLVDRMLRPFATKTRRDETRE